MKKFKNEVIFYDDNLPKHTLKGKECIWWEKTIGTEMIVEYHQIKYILKFCDYKKRYLDIFVNNKSHHICINSFYCRGNIAFLLEQEIRWKYNIGDVVSNKLKIIKRETHKKIKDNYTATEKWYLTQCIDCGYEAWHREDAKIGCACCSKQILIPGKNDLYTTHPHLLKYFINPDDAKKIMFGKKCKIPTKCPLCGNIKDVWVSNLNKKYSCNVCSDGISYPEKFFTNFLKQVGVSFVYQYRFPKCEWAGKYIYDYYLPQYDTIIEINGGQHYYDTNYSKVFEVVENDSNKKALAIHHVKRYIVINAAKSEADWIRDDILKSELVDFLDLTNIDWNKCHMAGIRKYVKQACDIWNQGYSVEYISAKLNVSTKTISNYLSKMNALGIIDFSFEENLERRKYEEKLIWENEWKTEDCAKFEKMVEKYTPFHD